VARYLFQLSAVTPAGSYVRLDSASGSTSPTAVSPPDSAFVFPGAILRSDSSTGELPRVAAGVATLYQKTLDASGNVTATATLTGTLVEGTAPGALPPLTFPIPVNTDVTGTGTYARAENPAWSTLQHPYDPALNVYNATPRTLRRFSAAVARALSGGNPVHVACYGDSITFGGNLTSPLDVRSYPGQLRLALSRRFTSAGTGLIPCWTTQLNDGRLSYTGSWTDYRSSGFATHAAQATGTGNTITLQKTTVNSVTTDVVCDSFDIYYRKSSTDGTFTATVDAQSPVSIDSSAVSESLAVTNVSCGSLGSHKLVITAPSSGTATIVAVEGVISGGQVKVTSAGYSGSQISHHTTATTPSNALYCTTLGTPDLAVVMLETNDFGQAGTSISTYTSLWTTLITQLQAAGSDVLIVATVPPQAPRLSSGNPTLAQYTAALYGLADTKGCALLDLQDRWTDWTTSNALGLFSDDYHPSQSGYYDIARAVFDVLARSWSSRTVLDDTGKISNGVQRVAYPSFVSGRWYGYPSATAGVQRIQAEMHGLPIVIGQAVTLQSIGINVTVAGSTGALARLGIYNDGTDGKPGTLVLDAGTVDCTTTGAKTIAISQTLQPGRYWLACALQGSPTTIPTIWGSSSATFVDGVGASSLSQATTSGWLNQSVAGALPSPFNPGSALGAGSPRVMVQIA
jgi:hypothetical protein